MEDKQPKRKAAAPKKTAVASDAAPKRATRSKATTPIAPKTVAEGAPKRASRAKAAAQPAEPAPVKAPRKAAAPKAVSAPAAEPKAPRKAKAAQTVAPKKESAFKAKNRKSSVGSTPRPIKKPVNKTPFWAPFAKKEAPKPEPDREERSERKRPSREKPKVERPERSSKGTSRPERSATHDRPSRDTSRPRPERPTRPDRPMRQDERPERTSRPQSSDRTSRSHSERPDQGRQLDRPDRQRFSKPMQHGHSAAPKRPAGPLKPDEAMRLNKFLSHCGIAARRQSAEFVKQGHVTINGNVEQNPSYPVQPTDEVRFKGEIVRLEERKVYILMNKPRDVITTTSDEKGRKHVMDLIGDRVEERIFPVGRLDRMTSGLLLLTNDGDLAKKLSHPSHKVQKVYHVTLDKPFFKNDFEKVQKGLNLEDGLAMVDSLHYIDGKKDELEINIHIGRNRIVRRIFEHLGYEVIKLDRTYYAGLTKKDIGRGHFRHLTEQEIIMLKHFK